MVPPKVQKHVTPCRKIVLTIQLETRDGLVKSWNLYFSFMARKSFLVEKFFVAEGIK